MSTQSPWKYEMSISIGGVCIEVNNYVLSVSVCNCALFRDKIERLHIIET
jgi:hypothetical protein